MTRFALITTDDAPPRPRRLEWLSWRERELAARLPDNRRLEWLSGRWLGKRLMQGWGTAATLPQIHIESLDAMGRSIPPLVYIDGAIQPVRLSISHLGAKTIAAASLAADAAVGCDLVELGPATRGFVRFWFTAAEQQWIRRSRRQGAAHLLWGLKESLYKALGRRQPFCPGQWDVLSLFAAAGLCMPNGGETLCDWQQQSALATCTIRRLDDCLAVAVALRAGVLRPEAQAINRTYSTN